jgi:hypothetical protein
MTFIEGVAGSVGDLEGRQGSPNSATVQGGGIAIAATLNDDGTTPAQVIVLNVNALQVDGTDTDGPTQATIYGWYDLYQRIDLENRQACVLSHPALQSRTVGLREYQSVYEQTARQWHTRCLTYQELQTIEWSAVIL